MNVQEEPKTEGPEERYGISSNLLDFVLLEQIARLNPESVVDFGAGAGKNGKLVRQTLGDAVQTTAVEGFGPTAEMLKHAGIYNNVEHLLIQDWCKKNTEHYDLAIFGDVLEHLTVSEIRWTIKQCQAFFDTIIVIVPLKDIYQDEMYDNKLEIHKAYIFDTFFDRYGPVEKHIHTDYYYTIMNVLFPAVVPKVRWQKRLALAVLGFTIPILQPLGLAVPFVRMMTPIAKMFGLQR